MNLSLALLFYILKLIVIILRIQEQAKNTCQSKSQKLRLLNELIVSGFDG